MTMKASGNAQQSEWSRDFHAARGDVSAPCPVADLGGHAGTCREFHPRGVVMHAAPGHWSVVPPIDPDAYPAFVEHRA